MRFLGVLFLAVSMTGPLHAQLQPPDVCAIEILADDQQRAYEDAAFRIPAETGDVCVLLDNPNLVKIHIGDYDAFLTTARLLRWMPSFFPVQTIYNGAVENDPENKGYCVLGYYKDADGFVANNEVTEEFLTEDPVVNGYGFMPVDVELEDCLPNDPTDPTDCVKTELVITIGKSCLDRLNAKVRAEICTYLYFQRKTLRCNKFCLVADKLVQLPADEPEDSKKIDEVKCKKAWLDLVNCVFDSEIGDDQSPGHLPDVCSGGNPNPGGCFIPQDRICNERIGASCGGQLTSPTEKCKKIKFNRFKMVGITCRFDETNPFKTKYLKDKICEILDRKKRYHNWLNDPDNYTVKDGDSDEEKKRKKKLKSILDRLVKNCKIGSIDILIQR
jgi:hypothetical protein